MNASPILVLGPNPAWQRVAMTASVRLGEVVRLRRMADCPAGKGLNCAQAIFHQGGYPILVGGCGPSESAWEEACRDEGVETASFPLDGTIRTALTLLDSSTGTTTEFVEEGPAAAAGADTFLELLLNQRLPKAAAIVACGSFPRGLSTDSVLGAWLREPIPLLVDSMPLARNLVLPSSFARVLVKLNLAEWQSLLGEHPVETLLELAQERWPGAEVVATLGRDGCAARTKSGSYLSRRPGLLSSDAALHPIGAGDAFTAGLAKVVVLGGTLEMGLHEGLVLSRASCLHPLPARFHTADLQRIREDMGESRHP